MLPRSIRVLVLVLVFIALGIAVLRDTMSGWLVVAWCVDSCRRVLGLEVRSTVSTLLCKSIR